jgi:hypothetical protein
MENNKKIAMSIIGGTWYVVISIFVSTYIRINHLPEGYEGAYWLSVIVYFIGTYAAVMAYIIERKE